MVNRAGAFYSIGNKKAQWKEKFMQLLLDDKKLLDNLEKDIQNNIKDMRSWKQVLDDDKLEEITEIIEQLE